MYPSSHPLALYRRRLKLTQAEAAKLHGIRLRTWQDWELGRGAKSVAMRLTLEKINEKGKK